MKTLTDPDASAAIRQRICRITPDSVRGWGKMTPHQMLCHLSDSYLMALGQRPFNDVSTWASRNIIKWVALNTPTTWPKDVPTQPQAEQGKGGTTPVDFEQDRLRLLQVIGQFLKTDLNQSKHPTFGRMTTKEWMRWGFLHPDHHLRQFGQ